MTGINPQTQALLSQLADIKGLDQIGWWPLAPGWWALVAIAVVLAASAVMLAVRRAKYRRSWQYHAQATLTDMHDLLDEVNAREILRDLSSLMRRIAIRRFSRRECAGLEGNRWLEWLDRHDPRGFRWSTQGELLTDATYAPPGTHAAPETIRPLIRAAQFWVR